MEFRTLKAEEIDVKVGNITKYGYSLLLYKNARVDMSILDETVGAENWQNKFYEVVENLYCSLGINVNYNKEDKEPLWIWKDDCGVESAFGDKEKGQASDARKRAGFAWGIGRELYTAPRISVRCETQYNEGKKCYEIVDDKEKTRSNGMSVYRILYNDKKEIEYLTIVDKNGEVVFTNEKENAKIPQPKAVLGGTLMLNSGKYQGKRILDVIKEGDIDYLKYLLSNDKVSDSIKDNIRLAFAENGITEEVEI